ncbi:PREDICTED: uncharacterized protein LOC105456715 [Wasmannia auropunctata]|uniref:uncharacterized protein LOC105456715 n=1 Tax=Wasmannia auropunctata TaxID=64793 RepID=UPI0005EDDBE4|nr:PREDICTED: uncharacterized protein LOC105456715 [Wasmannia auropunctata]
MLGYGPQMSRLFIKGFRLHIPLIYFPNVPRSGKCTSGIRFQPIMKQLVHHVIRFRLHSASWDIREQEKTERNQRKSYDWLRFVSASVPFPPSASRVPSPLGCRPMAP